MGVGSAADRGRDAVAGVHMSARPGRAQASHRPPLTQTHPPRWQSRAACIGSNIEFVPVPSDLRSELLAKHVCSTCPVRIDCLDDALTYGHNGIRGGHTEAEREWMRQGRRKASTCR